MEAETAVDIVLEPYQQEASDWLARRRSGLIIGPAGCGKTLIMAASLDKAVGARERSRKVKVGWMANTLEQCGQARDAIRRFPRLGECDVKIACAAAGTDWSDRDVLVVDECHHALAPSWFGQIESYRGALWGMSATPVEEEEIRFKELFGDVFTIERDAVEARLTGVEVVMLDESDDVRGGIEALAKKMLKGRMRFNRSKKPHELRAMAFWVACMKLGIAGNVRRTQAGARAARRHLDGHVIVLVNSVGHGQEVAGIVPGAKVCHSKLQKKWRAHYLDLFRSGECRCLVATSLADEGLDLPMADTLVLLSGGGSKIKAEQRTGRVARIWEGKRRGVVYDFLDRQHPFMERQAQKRMATYKALGYSIRMGSV